MATFTFSNDNRYYNPLCDSELLYQDEDGDTNRIFCTQSSCIAPIFSGAIGTCDNTLKPSGYTNRTFEWGVREGSWTLNANYAGFIKETGVFYDPFQITESEPGSECMINVTVTRIRDWTGYTYIQKRYGEYAANMAFKASWKKVGFTPMQDRPLTGTTMTPSLVGSKILTPFEYGNYGCTDILAYTEPPTVTYFDVGTRQVPLSNVATLKNAPIKVMPVILPFPGYAVWEADEEYEVYEDYGAVGTNQGQITWVACDANVNRAPRVQPYPVCCAQKSPSLTVDTSAYSTDRSNLIEYRKNIYNYNPDLGANNFGTINGTNGVYIGLPNDRVNTGYRMQKYVQKTYSAYFSQYRPSIECGAKDLECVCYSLGYKIRWEFVSATPTKCIIKNYTVHEWTPYYYVPPLFTPTGQKIRDGQWTRDPVSYIGTPTAWGDVQIRFTYEPYDYSTEEALEEELTATPWGSVFYPYTTIRWYDPSNNTLGFINFLLSGGRSDGSGYGSWGLTTFANRSYSTGYGFGAIIINDRIFDDNITHGSSLNGGAMVSDVNNVLSPRNRQRILHFEYPLNSFSSMSSLKTIRNGQIYNPQPLQTSKPNSTGYLWRRLVGDLNSPEYLDFTFSNRKQWFNGTCPFDLKYDNIESDVNYHPEACTSILKPIIAPT